MVPKIIIVARKYYPCTVHDPCEASTKVESWALRLAYPVITHTRYM